MRVLLKTSLQAISTSFFQLLSVRGWTSAFLLDVHRLCGAIEVR